jgi:transmembrane sensor
LALSDGRLQLDTDSAVDVKSVDGGSHIALFRGRVLARVTPGHVAPFVVETPEGTASALGTAFVVERHDGSTLVTVIESHVRACARSSGDCRDLAPGQRASIDRQRVSLLADVAPRSAATWSEGWLVADDRPVVEVLAELNRYRVVPARFDPARLAGVRVSGSFPLTDTDHALDGVARATGLALDRTAAEIVIDRR